MEKSVFTPLYGLLREKLRGMRHDAGLNQRQLAKRLGREPSFVARIELGERRVDLVEIFWICRALGQDPVRVGTEILEEFARQEPERRKKRR